MTRDFRIRSGTDPGTETFSIELQPQRSKTFVGVISVSPAPSTMADHMPQKALRFSLAALEVEAVQSTSSDWQRVLAATHTLIVGQGGGRDSYL